jgi:hypothetical protein
MAEKHTHPARAVTPNFTEIIETFGEVSREWMARAKSETGLASELVDKLTAARSFAETTTAYGEWMARRMELCAEDGRRFWADTTQKFMEAGTRLLSNGMTGASS